jgi:hypothetical protein
MSGYVRVCPGMSGFILTLKAFERTKAYFDAYAGGMSGYVGGMSGYIRVFPGSF